MSQTNLHCIVHMYLYFTEQNSLLQQVVMATSSFWKRQDEGVEFVKHFKAHMGEMIVNFYGSVFYYLNSII